MLPALWLISIRFLGDVLRHELKDKGHGKGPWVGMTKRPFTERLRLSDRRHHLPRFLHPEPGGFGDRRQRLVERRRRLPLRFDGRRFQGIDHGFIARFRLAADFDGPQSVEKHAGKKRRRQDAPVPDALGRPAEERSENGPGGAARRRQDCRPHRLEEMPDGGEFPAFDLLDDAGKSPGHAHAVIAVADGLVGLGQPVRAGDHAARNGGDHLADFWERKLRLSHLPYPLTNPSERAGRS